MVGTQSLSEDWLLGTRMDTDGMVRGDGFWEGINEGIGWRELLAWMDVRIGWRDWLGFMVGGDSGREWLDGMVGWVGCMVWLDGIRRGCLYGMFWRGCFGGDG